MSDQKNVAPVMDDLKGEKLEAGKKTFGYNRTTTDHIIKRSIFK